MNKKLVPKLRFKGFNDSWQKLRADKLFSNISKKNFEKYPVLSVTQNNGLTYRKQLDKDIKYNKNSLYSYKLVKPSNIVISLRSFQGGFELSDKIGIVSPAYNVLQYNYKQWNQYFWKVYFKSYNFIQLLKKVTYGIRDGRSISFNDFSSLKLNYTYYQEQQHIGTFFAKLDRIIELQSKKIIHLKQLKKGYLQKMFPQKGKNVPRLRFDGFHDKWNIKKLEKIINMFDNKRIPVTSNKRKKGNIGYYGANGIMDYVNGFTHIGHYVLLAEDGAKSIKNYPIHNVTGKIWVNNHAHVIKGKKDICNTDFLAYLLSEINLYPYLVGNGRYKLNANIMKKISLKVPSIQEQNQIGQFFKHLNQSITQQDNKLTQFKRLKKAYLQKMFI